MTVIFATLLVCFAVYLTRELLATASLLCDVSLPLYILYPSSFDLYERYAISCHYVDRHTSKLRSKFSSVKRSSNLTSSLFRVRRTVGVYRLYSREASSSQNSPILHTHLQTLERLKAA